MKYLSSFLIATFTLSFPVSAAVINVTGPDGDYLVIDNQIGDGSYTEPVAFGGQDTGQPDSWGGDRRWGNDGASTSASWSFDGLDDGTYLVFGSWREIAQANLSTAHYTGTDDFITLDLDQSPGAGSYPGVVLNDGTNNITFASLGSVTASDGNFTLTVDDSVTGTATDTFIFADAVALTAVPEPSSMTLLGLALIPLLRRRR